VRLCYFVSEYPAVSHTFIRREIVELERNNATIFRVSLRRNGREIVDPADKVEREKTRYILNEGAFGLVGALIASIATAPGSAFEATLCAIRMMRRSNRPFFFHLFYLAEALVLARWLRERDIEHIHAHFGTNGAEVAMLAHILTGIPYSFTIHGPDEFDRPEYLGLAEKAKHAAFIRVISSYTAGQLYRWIPTKEWRKVKVVRCGIGDDFLHGPSTEPRPDLSRDHLVTVGRLAEQKGQLILIEALGRLAREGLNFQMTIAGDGPMRAELENRIDALGLREKVRITGWVDNSQVRALLSEARALLMPSFAEGLPIVLMEAFALGRPAIATYIAGIPELVTDRVNGWLVPAGDVDALCRAIKDCLTIPDSRVLAMGQACRTAVLQRHDIARETRDLADLFRGHLAPDKAKQAARPARVAPQANPVGPAGG
jgi:colanic acid/amylovoran biosynthesis glycosyltransferase